MLEHDPTQYPDTNPLLRDGAKPSTAQILAPSIAPSAVVSSSAGTSRVGDSSGLSPAMLIGGAIVLVVLAVLIGGIVLAVVLTRRRGAPPGVAGR